MQIPMLFLYGAIGQLDGDQYDYVLIQWKYGVF